MVSAPNPLRCPSLISLASRLTGVDLSSVVDQTATAGAFAHGTQHGACTCVRRRAKEKGSLSLHDSMLCAHPTSAAQQFPWLRTKFRFSDDQLVHLLPTLLFYYYCFLLAPVDYSFSPKIFFERRPVSFNFAKLLGSARDLPIVI